MINIKPIEQALDKGIIQEYALRRCEKSVLVKFCNDRCLDVASTGKRALNKTVKADYIRALIKVRLNDFQNMELNPTIAVC